MRGPLAGRKRNRTDGHAAALEAWVAIPRPPAPTPPPRFVSRVTKDGDSETNQERASSEGLTPFQVLDRAYRWAESYISELEAKVRALQSLRIGAVDAEVLAALWKAYQVGQGSADHTDRQVFDEVVGGALKDLAAAVIRDMAVLRSNLEKIKTIAEDDSKNPIDACDEIATLADEEDPLWICLGCGKIGAEAVSIPNAPGTGDADEGCKDCGSPDLVAFVDEAIAKLVKVNSQLHAAIMDMEAKELDRLPAARRIVEKLSWVIQEGQIPEFTRGPILFSLQIAAKEAGITLPEYAAQPVEEQGPRPVDPSYSDESYMRAYPPNPAASRKPKEPRP